jgi:hypothetical protein
VTTRCALRRDHGQRPPCGKHRARCRIEQQRHHRTLRRCAPERKATSAVAAKVPDLDDRGTLAFGSDATDAPVPRRIASNEDQGPQARDRLPPRFCIRGKAAATRWLLVSMHATRHSSGAPAHNAPRCRLRAVGRAERRPEARCCFR